MTPAEPTAEKVPTLTLTPICRAQRMLCVPQGSRRWRHGFLHVVQYTEVCITINQSLFSINRETLLVESSTSFGRPKPVLFFARKSDQNRFGHNGCLLSIRIIWWRMLPSITQGKLQGRVVSRHFEIYLNRFLEPLQSRFVVFRQHRIKS